MEIIQNNPYRIAGILSSATEKELQKQKIKIKAYTKVGKEIKSDFDFQILGSIDRTEDSVNKAFSNIEQNQDKVNYALFWFLNASPFDNTAIEYLRNGDEEKALEIWEKVTANKDVNSKNFSAFNNLGTLKLLSENKSDIKTGIESKIKLIGSDYFENFVLSVADETYTIDNQKQSEKLIDELLTQFKNQYSSSETLQLFSGCNGTAQKYLSKKLTEEPLYKIENQIESCKKKRKADKNSAYELGLKLFTNTKDDLSFLKSILGTSDLKYKAVADQLANEIMQCGIDYFNDSQENNSSEDYLESAQKLIKLADSIAVGKLAKDKAKDSLSTLEEIKDRVVLKAIDFIQSVKDAYETTEATIRRQVKELEETDVQIRLGYKTINHSAVEDSIRNSIDWSKVNDLLIDVLSDKNLIKIKESSKIDAKKEFWELVNWLKDNSLKSSTVSIIIDKYKKIPPKISFKILSSEITNIDSNSNAINKPFYIENIRYVGLKLKVSSSESQHITVYKKYLNPNGEYSYSKNSPVGYTSSYDITIKPGTKEIDLGGWGNEKECTYQVGKHKIEIYVEHYKIYTKSFRVDWSPKKISELSRNLKLLHNELKEVEKFKWFRGSKTKQREVREVQNKIKEVKNILMNK